MQLSQGRKQTNRSKRTRFRGLPQLLKSPVSPGWKCGCSTAVWPTGAEHPNAKLVLPPAGKVSAVGGGPSPDSTHLLSFPGCICVYSTLNFLANNMKAFIGRLHLADALSPFAGLAFCFLFGFWREGGEPL